MKKFKESRTSPRQIYRTVNGLKNDLQHESTEELKVLVDQTLFQFGLKYDGDIYRKLNTGDEYPYHVWKALPTQNLTQRWLIGIWPGFDGHDYQFRIYAADTLDQIKNNEVEPLAEYEGTNSIDELISDLEDAFKYFINEDFKEFQEYPQEVWDQMVKEGRVDENGNLRDETFELIVDENDPVCDQFHIFNRGDFDAYMASLDHPLDESEKRSGENMELKIGDIVDFKLYGEYDRQAKVTEIGKIRGGYFAGRPYVEAYESWGKDHAAFSTTGHNFCFMRSSDGAWEDSDNEAVLDPKYWPYLDNFFGYNKITEAKSSEEDFQNWSKDKRKRYLDYLQKSVKSIVMGGESRHSADYNKPMTVKKTGSDTAFAYIVRYTNKSGVDMAYEFRGDGTKSEGLYGCFPNSQVQRLYKEFQEKESSRKSKKFIKEASESVSGLKWYQRGDTFSPNWGDNFIDAKAVDEELDAIVATNGGNEFQIKDPKIKKPLSFKIKDWYNFNGDNVEVELIFNREFEDGFDKEKWGTMHGDMASCESHYVEDWLNEHLADFGFEDYEIISSGWDSDTHTPTKGIHWYKYSMKNKDNTHKMPNYDDWTTGNSNLNGTEPFTKEEGKEIDKEVANYIAELMKANPKGVYGKDVTATPEDMENLILKVRPTGITWRGSYTHNYGYFAFEIDVKDYYDSEKENWRGQKGTTWGASEDDITSLLKQEAAGVLNDFLYEFNLEIVPDNCKAQWYHGSRDDVTYLEFDVYFKEIGIDPYKSYKAHSGNSYKDYWDGSEPKDLYKGKTFKRNPKRIKESRCFEKGQVFEGKNGKLYITKQISPDTYLVSYRDFLLSSLSFTDWTFSEGELKDAIRRVQSGEQLVWDHFQEKKFLKKSRNLKERVLDYDTWEKYYDEGCEAYFEGKTLNEVPITGNAWFREAWEEGWKNAKACDDEDARRAEAEYEEELEWEEAYREGLTESEEYQYQILKKPEIKKLDSLKNEVKETSESMGKDDVWVEWHNYAMEIGKKYLGNNVGYDTGDENHFYDSYENKMEIDPYQTWSSQSIDKMIAVRLACFKE